MKDKFRKIIIDGDTFVNRWCTLRTTDDILMYISLSNYLLAQELLNESTRFLEKYPDKLKEFMEEHSEIGLLFGNSEVTKEVELFIEDEERTIFGPLMLANKNLFLIIYKGIELSPDLKDKINPILGEAIAYAEFAKSKNVDAPYFTMNDEVIEFCEKYKFDFPIADMRI